MAKSIIQNSKECYVCGTTYNLHDHHIIFGTSNRKNSEKYGLKVWLCLEHHTGSAGVHQNREMDLNLKKVAQQHFEAKIGTRNEFRSIFGKSYL
jgi:hypothetical protein